MRPLFTMYFAVALAVLVSSGIGCDEGGTPDDDSGPGELSCEEFDGVLGSYLRDTFGEAVQGCQTVEDCVAVSPRMECDDDWSSFAEYCPVAVAEANLGALQADIEELADEACPLLADGGCMATPSCVAMVLDCKNNRCIMKDEDALY